MMAWIRATLRRMLEWVRRPWYDTNDPLDTFWREHVMGDGTAWRDE